jgi:hypothetical protein
MKEIMWWGYLHANGTIQVKRWFGDHKDYTQDCEGNDFVQRVVPPFPADTREKAIEIITGALSPKDSWQETNELAKKCCGFKEEPLG